MSDETNDETGTGTANFEGDWALFIESPMGKQPLNVKLKQEGTTLTGIATATGGQVIDPKVYDGTVDGAVASWKIKSKKPVPLTMKLTVTVKNDVVTGKCKPGMFGTFPVSGKRV